jgi:hypothetical protein
VADEFTSALSSVKKDLGDLHVSCVVKSPAGEKEGSHVLSKAKSEVPLQYKSAGLLTYSILGNKSNATQKILHRLERIYRKM